MVTLQQIRIPVVIILPKDRNTALHRFPVYELPFLERQKQHRALSLLGHDRRIL